MTVIISTCNRKASLLRLLESCGMANREGLEIELVIVDNYGNLTPEMILDRVSPDLSISLLSEKTRGKAFALNRALASIPLRAIIAVLDDDMTLDPGWFQGAMAITNRWPEKGFFTGRTQIVWPDGSPPAWAHDPSIRGWAFSALDFGSGEDLFPDGQWASGNHFWFRRDLLKAGESFPTNREPGYLEMAEPQLMLRLAARGHGGVFAPDALAFHHVQEGLLSRNIQRKRAVEVARGFTQTRFQYLPDFPPARRLKEAPIRGRIYAGLMLSWCCFQYLLVRCRGVVSSRFIIELKLLQRIATYYEYLVQCSRFRREPQEENV